MASKAKKKPDHSQLPKQYLFTGYFKKDKLVTDVKPVPNTLVFAEDPASASHKNDEPVILRTNEHGVLYGLSRDKETLLAPDMPYAKKVKGDKKPVVIKVNL
ncbi:hypothetical protein MNBD_GAMMA09-1775 [hydrothermal vent metagenome]|uniref:Uncharacterized protein n=1 Tax=hydrothermal vent metagenome TaxID=652676 RepID=A0A3B0XWS1_9ZZZZ